LRFRLADIGGAEGYLALQIREIHNIEIDQSNVPDASRGKVQAQGRAKIRLYQSKALWRLSA
jgi:hypothetical protein